MSAEDAQKIPLVEKKIKRRVVLPREGDDVDDFDDELQECILTMFFFCTLNGFGMLKKIVEDKAEEKTEDKTEDKTEEKAEEVVGVVSGDTEDELKESLSFWSLT